MTTPAPSPIVHESEVQRQHVRLPLPASVVAGGQTYAVRDLSSGGLGIVGITGDYKVGQALALTLHLPFGAFSLDVNLDGEIQHYNPQEKILGCSYTRLTTEQISLINHVLKAFLAGDVVASGDLLNVVARDGFVKTRKQNTQTDVQGPGFNIKKQIPGLAVMAVLGVLAITLIAGNIYDSLFVLKSSDAYISAPVIDVLAASDGIFAGKIPEGSSNITTNQIIAEITGGSGADQTISAVKSPCNCLVAKSHVREGEFVSAGTNIASLVSVETKPFVVATADPTSANRIKSGSKAKIVIAGTGKEFSGRVTDMTSGLAAGTQMLQTGMMAPPVFITILPDQPLPADLVNRPAQVIFTTN